MITLPVLLYHKIHPDIADNYTVPVHRFRRHLTILKDNGYVSVSCNQVYDSIMRVSSLPPRPVMITFDEGHISCYNYAKPILEESGLNAVFFVFGDWVVEGWLRDNKDFQICMNIEQLRELSQAGFEIAINGFSGKKFNQVKLNDIQSEITRSMTLFKKLEIPIVNALAYPFGIKPEGFWSRNKMFRMLKQQKVMLAFSKRNRIAALSEANRLDIDRIEINGKDTEQNFMKKLKLYKRGWFKILSK